MGQLSEGRGNIPVVRPNRVRGELLTSMKSLGSTAPEPSSTNENRSISTARSVVYTGRRRRTAARILDSIPSSMVRVTCAANRPNKRGSTGINWKSVSTYEPKMMLTNSPA
eukprot:5038568-Pyramimonas_sp.AAC.1